MELTLSLIMDIILLCMLGVTIFYALKLAKSLNAFKSNKQEFQALILELTKNIDSAYTAIENLKDTAQQSGTDLNDAVAEAKYVLDEMQLVNASSENLAKRLEQAGHSGNLPEEMPKAELRESSDPVPSWQETLKKPAKKGEELDSFRIRDRDVESIEDLDSHRQNQKGAESLGSQAEKDLYEALSKKKK